MPAPTFAKHVSARQLRANRRNARKSTGPRTAAGKRAVSLNALTHGVFCKDLVMPGESQAEFDRFAALLLEDLAPRDYAELSICEQYVEARWRIRRVRAAEHKVFQAYATTGRWRRENGKPLVQSWLVRRFPDVFRDPTPEEKREQDERYRTTEPPTIADTLCDSTTYHAGGQHESLGRSQQRLELSADRALRQLHRLRAERRKCGEVEQAQRPSPFIDVTEAEDVPDDAEPTPRDGPSQAPAQNKPIFEPTRAAAGVAEGCEQRACEVEPMAPANVRRAPVLENRPPSPPQGGDREAVGGRPGERGEVRAT